MDAQAPSAYWQASTLLGGEGTDYGDHPVSFAAFSVLEAMQDARVDTEILDLATTRFTKRRSALNEVVLYFKQSIATPAGQTLTINMPEGFRIPWEDSDDCLTPDPVTGVPPVDIYNPFGAATPDPLQFATMPEG